MSRSLKLLAGAILASGILAMAPQAAQAQHHRIGGGHYYHGGGHYHGGYYRGGGWGWGPGFALGFGLGAAPYYAAPYYYGGNCGWVRERFWRYGYWHVRRVWRCW